MEVLSASHPLPRIGVVRQTVANPIAEVYRIGNLHWRFEIDTHVVVVVATLDTSHQTLRMTNDLAGMHVDQPRGAHKRTGLRRSYLVLRQQAAGTREDGLTEHRPCRRGPVLRLRLGQIVDRHGVLERGVLVLLELGSKVIDRLLVAASDRLIEELLQARPLLLEYISALLEDPPAGSEVHPGAGELLGQLLLAQRTVFPGNRLLRSSINILYTSIEQRFRVLGHRHVKLVDLVGQVLDRLEVLLIGRQRLLLGQDARKAGALLTEHRLALLEDAFAR